MSFLGDIFHTVTAPARWIAKSPIGKVAEVAAPIVLGPLGIPVSAGIGFAANTDQSIGDMLKGAAGGAAMGAAGYGAGAIPGVGSLLKGAAGDVAGAPSELANMIPGLVGASSGGSGGVPATDGATASTPGTTMMGVGSLLKGLSSLGGGVYDIIDSERARRRAQRLADALQPTFQDATAAVHQRLGNADQAAADWRARYAANRNRPLTITSGQGY